MRSTAPSICAVQTPQNIRPGIRFWPHAGHHSLFFVKRKTFQSGRIAESIRQSRVFLFAVCCTVRSESGPDAADRPSSILHRRVWSAFSGLRNGRLGSGMALGRHAKYLRPSSVLDQPSCTQNDRTRLSSPTTIGEKPSKFQPKIPAVRRSEVAPVLPSKPRSLVLPRRRMIATLIYERVDREWVNSPNRIDALEQTPQVSLLSAHRQPPAADVQWPDVMGPVERKQLLADAIQISHIGNGSKP